jgi:uncharacterized protein (TIGR02145 family)
MIDKIIKDYSIKKELGQGGMATVYLAEHNLLGIKTAFKLLNKEFVGNQNIHKRFLAEARSMARMSHPNIVKVTDLIDDGSTVAFVMEYVEGESLKEYIDRKGKLSDEEINMLFSQMLKAVGYVHEQNLVHRDIKPSNFMVDPNGEVKLMDFGIAKNTDANSAEYTQTGFGMQMGTPMYMSPEQITETKSVTSQSDIYSLGVVLWQMVTGDKPYDTKTLSSFQLQVKIVQETLPQTNTTWDVIIEKATFKEIDKRFNSCLNFLNSFQNSSIDSTLTLSSDLKTEIKNIDDNDQKTVLIEIVEKTLIFKEEEIQTINIDKQVWMKENLTLDRFRNGDLIPEVKTSKEWEKAGDNLEPAWCYYENDSINGEKYGKLYNWFALNDPRGLAPEGWHIPSDEEWTKLIDELGVNDAGTKLKSKEEWQDNAKGTDAISFNALPGGYRNRSGDFRNINNSAYWWTITEYYTGNALVRYLNLRSKVEREGFGKNCGFSIRCLKD